MLLKNKQNREFLVSHIDNEIGSLRARIAELSQIRAEIASDEQSRPTTWREIIERVLADAGAPLTTAEITKRAQMYHNGEKTASKNPQSSVSSNLSAMAKEELVRGEKDPDGHGYLWSLAGRPAMALA